ncbi:MAG: Gldg family protein [Myxococcaceae bacterium]
MNGRSWILSLVFGLGLLAAFVGERLIGTGTARTVLTGLGVAAAVVSTGVRGLRVVRSSGDRRRVERTLLGFAVLGLVALALYFVQSESTSPKLAAALGALWPVVMALAVIPSFLAELAFSSMARAPEVELGRVRDATLSGLGLASVVVFAFTAYYVAAERDVKWDLSYFRTAEAGDATRNVVRALGEPVEVSVFFPPANEVGEQVMEYLDDLTALSPQFKVASFDEALDPKKARELGVSGNGTIVVAQGKRKELLGMGLELEKARGQLRSLDKEFQKRLLKVAKERRTLYFTTGHGERGADRVDPIDQRWTIRTLREVFEQQNYEVKNLGVAQGLAAEVPRDAAAVIVAGPTQAFLPEELTALERYLDRGGRVLLALDPEAKLDFADLLKGFGLRFEPTVLANDEAFLSRTGAAVDRSRIFTDAYSSHPAVTSLGRLGRRAPLLLIGAGALEALPDRPSQVRVDFTVHAHPKTFADKNANFEFDAKDESRRVYELAAAVTRTKPAADGAEASEARLVVFADSDLLGDPVFENAGNAYLALDGMKWLLGDDAIAGETNSEEDVRIQHTRKQDVMWFYSTVFLAPVLVLGVGFVVTRRKEARR